VANIEETEYGKYYMNDYKQNDYLMDKIMKEDEGPFEFKVKIFIEEGVDPIAYYTQEFEDQLVKYLEPFNVTDLDVKLIRDQNQVRVLLKISESKKALDFFYGLRKQKHITSQDTTRVYPSFTDDLLVKYGDIDSKEFQQKEKEYEEAVAEKEKYDREHK
jgi:hypothetical protein